MWWILIFLFPLAIGLWLLYEWMEHSLIQYNTTVVELQKVPKKMQIKCCLISDLHNNKKNISKIINRIRNYQPEFVLLAGDMIDKHKTCNRNAELFLEGLSRLEIPIYYSPGNHELSLQETHPKAWNSYIQKFPEQMQYLDNKTMTSALADGLCITGLSIPKPFYQKGKLYENTTELPELIIPEHRLHILMAHNPEYADAYEKYQPDIIVSGHLHGGLLRLPLIGGLVSPRLRLPKGCDAGLIQRKNNYSLFVSRGLGSHTIPLRFFNRVEINFLVLKGTKE